MEKKNLVPNCIIYTYHESRLSTVGNFLFDDPTTTPINLFDGKSKKEKSGNVNTDESIHPRDISDEADRFLKIKDNQTGKTNLENIISTFNPAEKRKYLKADKKSLLGLPENLLLKDGTQLFIPKDKVNTNQFILAGIELTSNNDIAFKAKQLAILEQDKGYVNIYKPSVDNRDLGTIKENAPHISVWIWCRSLSNSNQTDPQGQIFDVTPFIETVQINVNKQGGNFTFSLAPLTCEKDKDGKWIIKKNTLRVTKDGRFRPEYISESSMNEIDSDGTNYHKRSKFLFHNIVSSNDVVFIRFETLKIEAEDRLKTQSEFTLHNSVLPNKIYDMIGLVDQNTLSINPKSNDATIQITGRDLSKLFIEDGAYFYDIVFTEGARKTSGDSDSFDLAKRIGGQGGGSITFLERLNSLGIHNILSFTIQQLATIKVAPDTLFSAYGDRANVRYENDKAADTQRASSIQDKQVTLFEKNAKEGIEAARVENNFVIRDETGQIDRISERDFVEKIYAKLYVFVKILKSAKIAGGSNVAQYNPVTGDLSGWLDFYYENDTELNVNEIPAGIASNIFDIDDQYYNFDNDKYGIFTNINSVLKLQLSEPNPNNVTKEKARGIWQIIKLVIDDGIKERRISDNSFSTAQGSLVNFFKKVCQEPFVEYYTDTYGDAFYIIARKPPYDRIGVSSLLGGTVNTEEGRNPGKVVVVDIEDYDVISDDLSFDDSEAYSWYHLNPQAIINGSSTEYTTYFIPAVFFPEYADIWGSRQCDITSNYLPFIGPNFTGTLQTGKVYEQVFHDLKYLIEIGQYLPFVRKGTITMNGDRRIKVGNIIRYKTTGEIFFVDAVQHTFSISNGGIDRTTSIQVSKGMVEQLIYGIDIVDSKSGRMKKCSYFDIINTKLKKPEMVPSTETYTIRKPRNVKDEAQPPSQPAINNGFKYSIEDELSLGNHNDTEISKLGAGVGQDLQANVQNLFRAFLNRCRNKLGWNPNIIEGLRTAKTQAKRKKADNRNAAPGSSAHESGLAIDVNFLTNRNYPGPSGIPLIRGRTQADQADNYHRWIESGIPQLAKSMGLKWGGDFNGKHGRYYDNDHFYYPLNGSGGATYHTVYDEEEQHRPGPLVESYTNVLANFKVDIDVFNFFLRKEQFGYNRVTDKRIISDTEEDERNGSNVTKQDISNLKRPI